MDRGIFLLLNAESSDESEGCTGFVGLGNWPELLFLGMSCEMWQAQKWY